jgi:hypothetical protein
VDGLGFGNMAAFDAVERVLVLQLGGLFGEVGVERGAQGGFDARDIAAEFGSRACSVLTISSGTVAAISGGRLGGGDAGGDVIEQRQPVLLDFFEAGIRRGFGAGFDAQHFLVELVKARRQRLEVAVIGLELTQHDLVIGEGVVQVLRDMRHGKLHFGFIDSDHAPNGGATSMI